MVKSNWDKFKVKFSENPQDNFEWFCYLLFCKQYNKSFGIFRYYNQPAIETEPIRIGKEVIGFQSKFYEGKISSKHKNELVETVTKAKKLYPEITKIIFYINSEFTKGTASNEPVAQSVTNKTAKDLGITLEWKLESYFQSSFVCIDQANISSYFFEDNSIIDVLFQIQQRTESILNTIHSDILFNNEKIEINRGYELNIITQELEKNQILLIYGNAGVGKTALIKKLYENKKDIPFYIFNARDLNISNINELTNNYSFYDFIDINKDDNEKIIVIDSAEKLLDIIDNTPIIEFLSAIIKSNWKIIFTTRNSYLEDLQGVLLDTFRVPFYPIYIVEITNEQLQLISKEKNFLLPDNEKVLDLIKKPFYLNEYLKCYKAEEIFNIKQFKETLWNNTIVKRDMNRGKALLELSNNRADTGQFYILETSFNDCIDNLIEDGIIGNESRGYFIAHDIYEEWALEKSIDIHFERKEDTISFFTSIGFSLPIRRSFRNWISDKLLLNQEDIKTFIEDSIENKELNSFWKDEILIAVLLSNYSDSFFEYFENELLNDLNFNLLQRISFLLRLACKKGDKSIFENLGLNKQLSSIFDNIFVEPKGYGWSSYIKFIFNNLNKIDYKKMSFVLPVIFEWNNKYKKGETTRFASLIALSYYNNLLNENYYADESSNFIKTILFGASEIKNELEKIFDEVIKNKYIKHKDPYYELCKPILIKMEYNHIAKISPKYVLKLADLFWYKPQRKKQNHRYSELEEEYSLVDEHEFKYFPSSILQTPIFWCLEAEQNLTIDFILGFTNKTIKSFLNTKRNSHYVDKVKFSINNIEIEQIHNSTLWGMYRGMNTSPYLLQSILMALEVYLLNMAKVLEKKELQTLLTYLLIKAETSSITSVVTSIVVAYPEKTFDIALELFKVKEFIESDFNRAIVEHTNHIDMSFVIISQVHSIEREAEAKREHRKVSLLNIMFNYQYLSGKYKKEKLLIEEVIDNYYKKINKNPEENKDWKLFISNHIDLRNMTEKEEVTKDNQIIVSFEPKLDDELSNYKKNVLDSIDKSSKYTQLSLWSSCKFDNNEEHKEYDIYSLNIPLIIEQIKEILESSDRFNERIPIDCACILLRDFKELLNNEEKILCKEILINHIFHKDTDYNIEKYISVLPILIKLFPNEKNDLKLKFLKLLRKGYGVPTFLNMWETDYKDVYSLIIAYLALEPLYDIRYDEYRHREDRSGYSESLDFSKIWDEILEENKEIIEKLFVNTLAFENISNLESIHIRILSKAFKILPSINKTDEIRNLSYKLSNTITNKILLDNEDKVGYEDRDFFCFSISYIMLSSKFNEIDIYLKPIIDNFKSCELIPSLLDALINAQKDLNEYEQFWYIWEKFKEPIIELCKLGDAYGYIDKIIQSYLFSSYNILGKNIFSDDVKEWNTLKDKNRKFFKQISESIGHCVTTLDSLSTILNGVASNYSTDGIYWISNILKQNDFVNKRLGVNTIYNLEILSRKYIYKNRIKIIQTKSIKDSLLIILDFLIERGSSRAYILRERIL